MIKDFEKFKNGLENIREETWVYESPGEAMALIRSLTQRVIDLSSHIAEASQPTVPANGADAASCKCPNYPCDAIDFMKCHRG